MEVKKTGKGRLFVTFDEDEIKEALLARAKKVAAKYIEGKQKLYGASVQMRTSFDDDSTQSYPVFDGFEFVIDGKYKHSPNISN